MNLLQESRRILQTNGYVVEQSRTADDQINFEDDSLMGFVWEGLNASDIIQNWRQRQDDFLRKNATRFRSSEFKAWNIYCVLLTSYRTSAVETLALKQVEEDFRAARKIARADIETNSQLISALYPFVAIQHLAPFEAENPRGRLKEKLDKLPKGAVDVLFDAEGDEAEVWTRFVDSYENQ